MAYLADHSDAEWKEVVDILRIIVECKTLRERRHKLESSELELTPRELSELKSACAEIPSREGIAFARAREILVRQ